MVGVEIFSQGDPVQQARAFVRKHGLTYPVLVDAADRVATIYAVGPVPTNAVIGRDGRLRYLRGGYEEYTLREAIESALKE